MLCLSPNSIPTARGTLLPTSPRACDFRHTRLGTGQHITTVLHAIQDGGIYTVYILSFHAFSQSPVRDATWPSNRHRDVSPLPTAGDVRTRPYSTGWCKSTSRPIGAGATKATGMAVRCRPTSNGSSVVTWTAVSWPAASQGRVARNAAMILSSPIPAKGVGYARRATPGAWWRRQRIWSIMSSRNCRCASGCYRCRNGCAITFGTTGVRSRRY